jgi:protocatechuate 3,4-dioxygenase beta subunit
MDRDDVPAGNVLTRREAISFLGISGLALLGGRSLRDFDLRGPLQPSLACVVRPEQTEGPYFVDERLNRTDIRSDPTTGARKDGAPLALILAVSSLRGGSCAPLPGAHVDLWHCDADGVYSDVEDPTFNTVGQRFLRGYQITDRNGEARFQTIYPGWYPGRTVHLHFKIRTDPGAARGSVFTSQLYFDDALTSQVHARMPYAARGQRQVRNPHDRIFSRGGDELMLAPAAAGDGYAARFTVALQSS